VRRRPLVSALALALGVLAGEPVAGAVYTRPVSVPEAGLWAVSLDVDTHGFGPSSLCLTDSSGRPVPTALDEGEAARWLEGRVTGVERAAGGWRVTVELEAGEALHDRFRFEAVRTGLAEGVRLEARRDGAWEEIAAGSLFRLGAGETLQDLELSYEPTGVRQLRLFWPESAQVPELRAVRAAAVGGGAIETAMPPLEACTAVSPRHRTCLWGLPERTRRLEVDLEGSGALGFRLWAGEDGAWREVDSGVLPERAEDGSQRLTLERALPARGDVRLDLHGGARPTAARAERRVLRLLFETEREGDLILEYGEGVGPGPRRDRPRGAPTVLVPGPESERRGSPSADRRPGAAVPEGPLAARWEVAVADASAPWAVLELPREVYEAAGSGLSDVRLAAGDRLLPFLLVSDPAPTLLERRTDLAPSPAGERVSEVDLGVAQTPPWSQLLVRVGLSPLDRRVRLVGERERGPDGEERVAAGPWTAWTCSAPAPLPCVLVLVPPPAPAGARWRLEIDDGDDAPLPAVEVEIHRRGDRLRFPVPVEGRLLLLAGRPDLGPPRFDLAARAGQVLAEPAVAARARRLEPATPVRESRLGQALWLLGLAAAVAVLLRILARVLARSNRA